MSREIVFDTETTGFEPKDGHRLVEIGAIELINHIPTDREPFHVYINPDRDMPEDAFKVHGISGEFLKDKPRFREVAQDFIDFVGDAKLVAHNAMFDMKFINAELEWVNKPTFPLDQSIDTLAIARKKFPGSPATLDALCKRFNVDASNRTLHGALIDADLLAQVYIELLGGRQQGLSLGADAKGGAQNVVSMAGASQRKTRAPRSFDVPAEELERHAAFVSAKLKDAIWERG